jgi:hypothetical protein
VGGAVEAEGMGRAALEYSYVLHTIYGCQLESSAFSSPLSTLLVGTRWCSIDMKRYSSTSR